MNQLYRLHHKEQQLRRLAKSINAAKVVTLSRRQRYTLVRRVLRLQRQLLTWRPQIRWTKLFAASLVALSLLVGTAQAQSFGPGQQNPFGLSPVGGGAAPCFGDLDNDGDLDMFSGEGNGALMYFQNAGTADCPDFAAATNNPFGLTSVAGYSAPVFANLDGDADLDLLVGSYGNYVGSFVYYQNTGTASNPAFGAPQTNPFGLNPGSYYYPAPAAADIDNDGDLDVMAGEGYGAFLFYLNTGTSVAPAFASVQVNPFGLSAIGDDYSAPNLIDIDDDGDLDLMSGGLAGDALYFPNTGSAVSPAFGSMQTNPFGLGNSGPSSFPFFTDLDDDGDDDALVGELDFGNFTFYENTEVANTAPTGDDDAITGVQDNVYSFQAGDFTFSDTDGGAFTQIQITQLEGVGTLEYNGSAVTLFQTIPVNDMADLQYTPLPGEFGQNYDSFRFKVGDCFALSGSDYLMTINVTEISGIDDASLKPFVVFPNPATDELHVRMSVDAKAELLVHDVKGVELVRQSVSSASEAILDLSSFSAGLYQLTVRTDSRTSTTTFAVARP